jgi:lipopolysaccharide/colanic/teichoic acid biosynthesis glycosyltransferase
VLIKCVSEGPVFFKQDRVGFRGQHFTMLKLRTYHVCGCHDEDHKQHVARFISSGHPANGAPMKKLDNHPGIIPFGRFLRKTCIDELPQLINVLKGQMSLVGPRPALPYEVELYSPWHFERFDVVPGMTGLWQVSGKNDLTFDQMVSLDIQYARRLSLWLDLYILVKTPFVVARQFWTSLLARPAGENTHPAAAPAG